MEDHQEQDALKATTKQPNSSHCFVCGVDNEYGLSMKFYETSSDEVIAEYTVPERYQGYPGVVHGGIVAAMLDEVVGRTAMIEDHNRFWVTAKMEIRYRNTVPIGEPLRLIGRLEKKRGRLTVASAELRLPDDSVGADVKAVLADQIDTPISEDDLEALGWKVYPD
jgi:acyl-coenzyme A thioesterase PaaI-like protein